MALTLAEIAARLGGRIAGDPQVTIGQVGTLEHAQPGEITFYGNSRFRQYLQRTRAGAVILRADAENLTAKPRIVCDNPYAYFARVSQLLNPVAQVVPGIDGTARIAKSARIGEGARIDAYAVIEEGAEIGERCWIGSGCAIGPSAAIGPDSRLHPSVVIYAECRIGARALVHSGVVIGADGFGFALEDGIRVKIPQIGRVLIGDDFEIGANSCVDRGAIGDTVIEDGVKIDNHVQVGHNCRIGAHTVIAGCVGIAGSCTIGRRCVIAGASMLLGHLTICDDVHVSMGTAVSHSIRKPGMYSGFYPMAEHAEFLKNGAHVRHLADLANRVRALERLLEEKDGGNG